MYSGMPEHGMWNRHWPPGAGEFGWKLDVEKEIPYYQLEYSGARSLMNTLVTPLRVAKRFANSLLWSIFNSFTNSTLWVEQKPKGWKKDRNDREAQTLSRVLDLAIVEFGTNVVEKSAAFEVLLRRLHAVYMADQQGNWNLAHHLEEIPTDRTATVHEVIIRDVLKAHQLTESTVGAKDAAKMAPSNQDDD